MTLMTWAILILALFVVIWVFFVVPAEKRHPERKLESLRSRIEKSQSRNRDDEKYAPPAEGEES